MADGNLRDAIKGKEVHFRLVTNDLLESGKASVTAVGSGSSAEGLLSACRVETKNYTQYPPESMTRKLTDGWLGRGIAHSAEPNTVVVVAEKNGSLSADDARYVEWLAGQKREYPRVLMISEGRHAADPAQPRRLLSESAMDAGFWERQWRRVKALPAPITRDAALAAIPRTAIPVAFSLFLGILKIASVPFERTLIYTGLAFGFAVGFALFNQTVLNYLTFCSELTRDICDPALKAFERRFSGGPVARLCVNALAFVSARGDVLIAAPSLGIGCNFISRLALGAVGETASVLTFVGFLVLVGNVLVGSFAGGPYGQVVAHLRAVGRISNRASMYLGIVETIKMELGRLADFGMQTLFNAAQLFIAVFFWALLLVVDRCYLKPEVTRLTEADDLALAARLFAGLKARAGVAPAASEAYPAGLPAAEFQAVAP